MQHPQVVLEQTPRRRRYLGRLRALPHRRVWYASIVQRPRPARADYDADSNFARHAFDTFLPISVESEARTRIIFDFFDLLSAVAARGKSNGMGGRKLSRLAGWWAFEFVEDGKGFDGGYRTWEKYAPFLWWRRPRADCASELPTLQATCFSPTCDRSPQSPTLLAPFLLSPGRCSRSCRRPSTRPRRPR